MTTPTDTNHGCECTNEQPPHICPYAEEMGGHPNDPDDKWLCTCCEECEYQCAMDV